MGEPKWYKDAESEKGWLNDYYRYQREWRPGYDADWWPQDPTTFLDKKTAAKADQFLARMLSEEQFRDLFRHWSKAASSAEAIEQDTRANAAWGSGKDVVPPYIK